MADIPKYSEKDKKDLQTVILDAVKSSTFGDNIGKHIANSKFAESTTKNLDIIAANIQQSQKNAEQSPQRQILDSIVDKASPQKPKNKKPDAEDSEKQTNSESENKASEAKEKSKGRQVFDVIFGEINKTKGFTEFKENLKAIAEQASAPVRVAKGLVNIFRKPKAEETQKQDATKDKTDASTIPILRQSPQKTSDRAEGPVENKDQPKPTAEAAKAETGLKPSTPKEIATKAAEPAKGAVEPPKPSAEQPIATEPKSEEKTAEPPKSKGRQVADLLKGEIAKSSIGEKLKEAKEGIVNHPAFRIAKGVAGIFSEPKQEPQKEETAKKPQSETAPKSKPAEEAPKAETEAKPSAPKEIAAKAAEPSKGAIEQPKPSAEQPPAKAAVPKSEEKTSEPPKSKPTAETPKAETESKPSAPKEIAAKAAEPAKPTVEQNEVPSAIDKTTANVNKSPQKEDKSVKTNKGKSESAIDGESAIAEQKKESTALALSAKAKQQHGSAEKTLHSQKMAMIAEEAEAKQKDMKEDEASQEKKLAMADERIKKKEEELGAEGKKNKGILGFLKAEALTDAWKTAQNLKNSVIRLAQSAKEFAIEKARALGQIAIKIAHGAAGVVKSAFMLPFPVNLVALGVSGAALVAAGLWARKQLSGVGGAAPSGGGASAEQKEEKTPSTNGITPESIVSKGGKDATKKSDNQDSAVKKKQMERIMQLMEQISEKLDKIASAGGMAGGNTYNYTETTVPQQPGDDNNGVSTSNVFDAIRYAITRTR